MKGGFMANAIETLKTWADTFHQDVDALKALVESEKADLDARKHAAAALNYLVTRMDLIPDWNEGIGALDDAMILRVCAQLAQQHPLGDLAGDAEYTISRLSNEAERLTGLLGNELAGKLRGYCAKLVDTAVRGRTPLQIIEDPAARKALWGDVEEELKKSVPVVVTDPADAELRLKAYLEHKL
jgi:uncharacterized membrane protein YkvA (DUF1232 family)